MDLGDRLCNLCVVKCENFKCIEGNRKMVLDMLLPAMEFTAIPDPVVCENCEEILRKCFDFKTACLHTYDYLVPLVNCKDAVKLDLKDVYLNKHVADIGILENHDVCGFCMSLVQNCNVVSLDVNVNVEGVITLKKMMELCLPELDVSIIKNPVICDNCYSSLENCFHFVTNCLSAEEKIKKYSKSLGINNKSQNSLLYSKMRSAEASDIGGNSLEVEEQSSVKIENLEEDEISSIDGVIKLEQSYCNDSEYVNNMENKNESFMLSDNQKINNEQQFTPRNMVAGVEGSNKLGTIKTEEICCGQNETEHKDGNFIQMDEQKFILTEEIEIKTDEHDFNRFEESILKQPRGSTISNRRRKCLVSNLEKKQFKSRLKQTSMKSTPEILYQGAASKVTMYKCNSCSFQAKLKNHFKRHMLIHKDHSKVTMLKCNLCLYLTKYRGHINQHLVTHKASSDIRMFNCESCPFQTRQKHNLKTHMLKHIDSSEVTVFNCNFCSFRSKYKNCLNRHLLTHDESSEKRMYSCYSCGFQTRWKFHLKNHMWKHMDPSEITVHKCDACPYFSRRKHGLTKHMLKHKDPSEVAMFNCDVCSYKTLYKEHFKKHVLTHKASSEVTMYSCDICPYRTRQNRCLKNHMLKHKDPSEITMFTCDFCSFQTKYKLCHEQHSITHKPSSEVVMFKCNFCSFQSKYKRSLKRHLLTH